MHFVLKQRAISLRYKVLIAVKDLLCSCGLRHCVRVYQRVSGTCCIAIEDIGRVPKHWQSRAASQPTIAKSTFYFDFVWPQGNLEAFSLSSKRHYLGQVEIWCIPNILLIRFPPQWPQLSNCCPHFGRSDGCSLFLVTFEAHWSRRFYWQVTFRAYVISYLLSPILSSFPYSFILSSFIFPYFSVYFAFLLFISFIFVFYFFRTFSFFGCFLSSCVVSLSSFLFFFVSFSLVFVPFLFSQFLFYFILRDDPNVD